jgi:plastocyanin
MVARHHGGPPWRILTLIGVSLLMLSQIAFLAYAAETHDIIQKDRSFNVKEINVAAGDIIQFHNDDDFIHQIYVDAKSFNFDTDESPPGNVIAIKFTTPGTFEVHCHIHPKMELTVNVK